jgi:ferredoxin
MIFINQMTNFTSQKKMAEKFMAIPTTRAKECADINIDIEKCNGYGLCVSVCKDYSLVLEDGKVKL